VDTTFLRPQRFSTPQTRFAGVVAVALDGTRSGRETVYSVYEELSLGDRLRRSAAFGSWRKNFGADWQLFLVPGFEYRWDHTLDRDFEEYTASATSRARRAWGDGSTAGEFGVQGEWLRTVGPGAGALPSRQSAALLAAVDHAGLGAADWRADYAVRARAFPDTSDRNHFEHELELHARWAWGLGHSLTLEAGTVRRVTMHVVTSSLDNFWQERGAAELFLSLGSHAAWPSRAEVESQRYDLQDSLLAFDYVEWRAQTGWQLRPSPSWNLTIGPRAQWLDAPLNPGESFREVAGFAELEVIGLRALWSVTPGAGWRDYPVGSSTAGDAVSQHSSYGFVELEVIADQPVGSSWRVRVAGTGRSEFHSDTIENAGSLYFSLDVRRLF
jgi:hypothetical protein